MKPALLIVDDDEEIQSQLHWALSDEYDVSVAGERASALAAFRDKQPLVVLLDLGLPPHPALPDEGLATLSEMLSADRLAKVIVASGQSEKGNALQAIGQGAYDFLCKPVAVDELKVILRRAFHVARLEKEYRQMQQRLAEGGFEGMLGSSESMLAVFSAIRKVATTEVPVLILGESGTGKEMVARAIHQCSSRKEGPFTAINCGAIPENLLESELFGHEKGSFTGAHVQRKGRIETAAGGTLFLDEIGELTLPLQVKLLRFLQEQQIERIGGRTLISVDCRVLAATNSDLKAALGNGKFREDLFYRLAVVVLKLPPLRLRPEDIELLAKSFLRRQLGQSERNHLEFSREALNAMLNHPWPGNVRELENRVRRATIMAEGTQIGPADLELEKPKQALHRTLREAREAVEKELVEQSLRTYQGKVSRAAEALGISRPTFYELMEKLGIAKQQATHEP